MKRPSTELSASAAGAGEEALKKKQRRAAKTPELGEDLVYEVLARSDPRTLARAGCVSRRLRQMAEDERLWEAVCTPHWAAISCGRERLRLVVLAMGGFRRLHTQHMVPLRAASASPAAQRWDKNDLQICLSLLSLGHFERMHQLPAGRPGSRGVEDTFNASFNPLRF